MRAARKSFRPAVVLALLLCPLGCDAQSVAEAARQAKQRKDASSAKVWTNDELGEGFPEIKLLRTPRQHPPVLAPYLPTPIVKVRRMLEVAGVRPGELLMDIGSGDGRIVILAAEEFGARAVGIEIDPEMVARSRRAIAARGLDDRVRILQANALDVDLSPADVVAFYLTPEGVALLRLHLERTLRPGTRVVSFVYRMPKWTLDPATPDPEEEIWLYRIP